MLGSILLGLIFGYFAALFAILLLFNQSTALQDEYDYIIVLGNKSKDETPSSSMEERVDAMLRIRKDYPKAEIIFSGGNGEAELMLDLAQSEGFRNVRYWLDTGSKTTYDNLVWSKNVASGKVLVITSDYHVLRTSHICGKLGLRYDVHGAKSREYYQLRCVLESIWLGAELICPDSLRSSE